MSEIEVAGEPFNIRLDGDEGAPVVVLAHQLGGSLEVFDDIVPALAERFRVVRFDARGHGRSVVGTRPGSIEGFARDALAILDALGVARAHWIGLSMGAIVGQALMLLAPARVGRAVLANTAAKLGACDVWNGRIAAVRKIGPQGMAEATEARWFTPEFRQAEPAAVARVMAAFRATPSEGYANACAALRDADFREAARGVTHEALIVVGARDPSAPPELGRYVAQAIPGARLVTLDVSHISVVEDAAGFAAAALDFLAAPQTPRVAPAPRKPAARRPSGRPTLAVRTKAASATVKPTGAEKSGAKPAPAAKGPSRPKDGPGPKGGGKGGPKGGGKGGGKG